jgi:hypothetical protein
MSSLSGGRAPRIWMRPRVDEAIAVWRTTSQKAVRARGEIRHGGSRSQLNPRALPFRHAAEEVHHQVVSLRSRVDGSADLWNPKLDAVVGEDGEGEAELVAIEGPLRLTDHDAVEAAIRLGQRVKEASTLRAPLPRQ